MAIRPPEVFVSYAREDSAFKADLIRWMWEWAIPVWSDEEIERGHQFPEQLRSRIEGAAAFVLLMSPDSRASEWVERELLTALGAQVPIFPLLLSGEPFERIAPEFHYDAAGIGQEPPAKWFRDLAAAAGIGSAESSLGHAHDGDPDSERLVGRARDVRAMRDVLVDPAVETAIISGFAGIGTSSLVRFALRSTGARELRSAWLDASRIDSVDALELLVDSVDSVDSMGSTESVGRAGSHAEMLVVVLDGLPSRVLEQHPPWRNLTQRLGGATGASIKLVVTSRGHGALRVGERHQWEMVLQPLQRADSLRVLERCGFPHDDAADELCTYVGDNPLLLRRGCEHARAGRGPEQIMELLAAELDPLIATDIAGLDTISRSSLEMVALACEPVRHDELDVLLAKVGLPTEAAATIDVLLAAGWLRSTGSGATVVPVVSAAIAAQTVAEVAAEMASGRYELIGRVRLLSAASSDSVQRRQRSRHLGPLVERLHERDRTPRACLDEALASRELGPFAVGNLLNLAITAGDSLTRVDLAGRIVTEADLRSAHLHDVSFRDAQFDHVALRRHVEGIIKIAVDPSWTTVVAGAADGRIHVFSPIDGSLVANVTAHDDLVTDIAFNRNGTLLVTSSDDRTVRLWDARDWMLLRTLHERRGLNCVDIDPIGDRVVAGGYAATVNIWNRHSGEVEWSRDLSEEISKVAFDDAGAMVAIGTRAGSAEVWECVGDRLLLRIERMGGSISGLSFEEEGRVLAVSSADARTTTRWNIGEARQTTRLPRPLDSLGVTFSEDGTLLATSIDQSVIEVWDRATGARLLRTAPDDLRYQSIVLSATYQRLIATGDSAAVRCWDLADGQELWTMWGHSSWVKSAKFVLNDAALACCADDQQIHVWERHGARPMHKLSGHRGHVRAVAKHHLQANRLYSGSDDRTAGEWDVQDGRLVGKFEPHDGPVWSVAASPLGDVVATGTLRGTVTFWSAKTRDQISSFKAHDGAVRSVAFDASGQRLVTGGDDARVKIWTIGDAGGRVQLAASLEGHDDSVWCVDFGRTTRAHLLVSASMDATVRLWHFGRAREVAVLRGHDGPVWSAVLGHRGSLVLSGGSDHTIKAWSVPWTTRQGIGHRVLEPQSRHAEHDDWVRSVELSSDERLVLSGSHDGSVALWDTDLDLLQRFPVLRPYEGVDVRGVRGLSAAERASLAELGALTTEA